MDLYYAEGELVHRRMLKAAEVEFPLRSPRSPTNLFPRWKAKRAVEWKYLAALHNPSVEELRMRFDCMEIQGVELMHCPGAPTVPTTCLSHWPQLQSPSLTLMATSSPPGPARVVSPVPRCSPPWQQGEMSPTPRRSPSPQQQRAASHGAQPWAHLGGWVIHRGPITQCRDGSLAHGYLRAHPPTSTTCGLATVESHI